MAITTIPANPTSSSSGVPNQKALDALINRYLWFMARRELAKSEMAKRSKQLRSRNRAAPIKS